MTSEIIPLLAACRWLEQHARRVLGPHRLVGASVWQFGQRHRVERVALGRVAIIATWNYPIQLLGVQMAQALVAGNSVHVKPSERSSRSQTLLLDLAIEAGVSPERVSRTEPTREAGEALLRDHRFDHVVFTGSTGVGREIARALAASLTPSTLELSGSDSAIVLADADAALAARSIAFALELNAGRTCMAPRRAIVERPIYEMFLRELLDAGEIDRERVELDEKELQPCREVCERAVAAGGRWIGDDRENPPFVVADCPTATGLFAGEHFGPALAVTPVADAGEALDLHAAIDQKLATSVFTADTTLAGRLAPRLGSSVVTINDCVIPTGHPGASLGGIGPSGWGLTRGAEGLLAMTRPVFVASTGRVRVPTSPPTARAKRGLARVVRVLYG